MGEYKASATWMIADKVVSAVCQLASLFLLSNYLGAHQFGEIVFAYSLSLVFLSLNQLGLEQILIKRMVEKESQAKSILYHGTLCRVPAGIVSFFLVNWIAVFFELSADGQLLVAVISLIHLIFPFHNAGFFFQAKVMGKYSAIAFMAAYVAALGLRAIFVFNQVPLFWYGFSYVLEAATSSVLMWWLFFVKYKHLKKEKFHFSMSLVRSLLKDGAPLILAGAIVFLYMRTDQMMLQVMLGSGEVGVYTAAVRLSEAWFFIGITILGAYFPKVIKAKKEGQGYEESLIRLGSILCAGAILLSITTCVLSEWLVGVLYSAEYARAANVLNITIWTVVFAFLGGLSSRMLVVENMQKFMIFRSIIGLVLNAGANLWLIPLYGIEGAAIGTLVAQISASFLSHIFSRRLWHIFYVQLKCLFCFGLLPRYRYALG